MKKFLASALFLSAILLTSCTDGSIIGNDLLDDQEIDLVFEENFELNGQTVLGDSLATFISGTTNQTYMLGDIDDPIFGKYTSDIYTAFRFNSVFPNFDNAVLDSIVLDLEYDASGFYGDTLATHTIEVFRVTEEFVNRDSIFSNESFETEMMPLANVSLVPSLSATIPSQLRDFDVDSTVQLSPRLRIRLDDAFGMEILADSLSASSDSALVATYNGLYIRSSSNGLGMMGLNFNENPEFNDGIARLHMYYTTTDEEGTQSLEEYSYILSSVTSSTFTHDYAGSVVENALNDTLAGDEFLYVQNMAGVNSEIFFPDLNVLDNFNEDTIIINAAQLVFTINEDMSINPDIYPNSAFFLLSKDNEDGDARILIDDITQGGIDVATGFDIHDGVVKDVVDDNGNTIKTVTFVITKYVQNLLKDDISSSKVTISPVGRTESPRRTVFYGINHPDFPAKLRIAYTKI